MFHVDQKVVCVDDGPAADGLKLNLRKGEMYTIREIATNIGLDASDRPCAGLRFYEIGDPPIRIARNIAFDGSYASTRFRPVREHSIQIFRDIANGVKQKENA